MSELPKRKTANSVAITSRNIFILLQFHYSFFSNEMDNISHLYECISEITFFCGRKFLVPAVKIEDDWKRPTNDLVESCANAEKLDRLYYRHIFQNH